MYAHAASQAQFTGRYKQRDRANDYKPVLLGHGSIDASAAWLQYRMAVHPEYGFIQHSGNSPQRVVYAKDGAKLKAYRLDGYSSTNKHYKVAYEYNTCSGNSNHGLCDQHAIPGDPVSPARQASDKRVAILRKSGNTFTVSCYISIFRFIVESQVSMLSSCGRVNGRRCCKMRQCDKRWRNLNAGQRLSKKQ